MGIFFLLLPKQLQAWKGIRHRATSNLLACKKKKKKNWNVPGMKKKKGYEKVDGQKWGRDGGEKALEVILIGYYIKSRPQHIL